MHTALTLEYVERNSLPAMSPESVAAVTAIESQLMQCEPKTCELPAMSSHSIAFVTEIENTLLSLEQVDIVTTHVLHGGMYSRTVFIPAGVIVSGTLIKVPTTVIVSGWGLMYAGEGSGLELKGYHVLEGGAGRKQVFVAKEDTYVTMSFATDVRVLDEAGNYDADASIAAAEDEFTDEADKLMTRRSAVSTAERVKREFLGRTL